jgi:hypothetical protein
MELSYLWALEEKLCQYLAVAEHSDEPLRSRQILYVFWGE